MPFDGNCHFDISNSFSNVYSFTYIEGQNVITSNEANGIHTKIISNYSGSNTIYQTQTANANVVRIEMPTFTSSRIIYNGEGKVFDTDNYFNAVQTDENFVDMAELMKIIGAEVGIITFIALATELTSAWAIDKNATPAGLNIMAETDRGNYGGEDPDNTARYRRERPVSITTTTQYRDGVRFIKLKFKMPKGDRGRPGTCPRR